jgi:hypothetical protein
MQLLLSSVGIGILIWGEKVTELEFGAERWL